MTSVVVTDLELHLVFLVFLIDGTDGVSNNAQSCSGPLTIIVADIETRAIVAYTDDGFLIIYVNFDFQSLVSFLVLESVKNGIFYQNLNKHGRHPDGIQHLMLWSRDFKFKVFTYQYLFHGNIPTDKIQLFPQCYIFLLGDVQIGTY